MRILILSAFSGLIILPLKTKAQNLVAWYDATDASTVHTTGSAVTQLDDKSSSPANHYNLTSSGSGTATYHAGALAYINFPDNTIQLQRSSVSTIGQPYTVYMIVRQNSFQNGNALATFNNTDPDGGAGVKQSNAAGIVTVVPHAGPASDNDDRNKLPNLYSTSWRLLKFVYNGSQSYETVNGGARLLSFLFPFPDPNPVHNPSTFSFLPGPNSLKMVSIGGGANLDFSEMLIYNGILTDANAAIIEQGLITKYGLQPVIGIKGFGDSITSGLGTSDPSKKCWLFLTATEKNKNYYNYGIVQTVVYGRDDIFHPEQNLYGFTATRVLGQYGTSDYCFFGYGTNDVAVGIDADWKDTYKNFIQQSFIAKGYALNKLIICSTPYNGDPAYAYQPSLQQVRNYVQQIATELGIQFADLYTQMKNLGDAGAASKMADQQHMNDVGNRFAADYYKTFIDNFVPLPVTFTLFNSVCSNGDVKLRWKTTQETNSKRYDVERSIDGRTWNVIGSLNSAGTTSGESSYTYSDNTSSLNFLYRIASYDANNKKTYTSVLKSSCSAKEEFSLYPNPVGDIAMLNITAVADAPVNIKVYDSKGALVKSIQAALLQGNNQLQINVSGLAKGTYSLSAGWNGVVRTTLLVK